MTASVRILDQRTPEEAGRPFLPGMGKSWLLPLYDNFSRVTGVRALQQRAVALAGIAAGVVQAAGPGSAADVSAVVAVLAAAVATVLAVPAPRRRHRLTRVLAGAGRQEPVTTPAKHAVWIVSGAAVLVVGATMGMWFGLGAGAVALGLGRRRDGRADEAQPRRRGESAA